MADRQPTGILPAEGVQALAEAGHIVAGRRIEVEQYQPASLDLRLGETAYRVRASFLPGPQTVVGDRLDKVKLHEFSLADGAVLETGCVYIVPLMESLKLPEDIAAAANPKSSTGRLDVFTRIITDRTREFDAIPAGYQGPLYIEISPRTFPVLVRAGSRLSQMRFRRGDARLDDKALIALHRKAGLVDSVPHVDHGLTLTIDLGGTEEGIVGYRAKRHTAVIDVDKRGLYDVTEFWEPIARHWSSELVLDPDQFYILVSREAVHVPPDYAAEMVPFDPLVGEFRVHYAGFFDPGFGHSESGEGSRAVLEVRSHEVPFILEHGQTVGRLVYEAMTARPAKLYGEALGSNYQAQGLKLSKHFRVGLGPGAEVEPSLSSPA
jgi:dCTP deaminase